MPLNINHSLINDIAAQLVVMSTALADIAGVMGHSIKPGNISPRFLFAAAKVALTSELCNCLSFINSILIFSHP